MDLPLAPKQLEFIINSTARWNIAHGSVRSGKTVGTLFRFMQAVENCPDSQIFMSGHTSDTIYQNAIRLLLESEQLSIFRPFCTWFAGKRQLKFRDKTITTLGAKDEGAIGQFQGKTFSLFYGDEMTLYPESIIDMIDTRLSNPHSMGFATMNPSHPTHKLKKWIDMAEAGDKNYYALHYNLDDNPYLDEDYKLRIKNSLSGVFFKRNYLGLWCLAEGAIFDFFDRSIHVVKKPPRAAEYWIAGIDYGTVNSFACTLVGINTGRATQTGVCRWAEKEYVWDSRKKGRQKTNSEYADDVADFLEPYGVKAVYVDPSAAAFRLELRKRGLQVVDADNDVINGITFVTSEMQKGNLFVCEDCPNLIREIESYVWDPKASERGEDAPLKKDDHCFHGDTLVLTDSGLVKIKDIETYHKVLTREGFKRVIKKHCKWGYVFEYDVHGYKVRCTSDHKFFTLNRDWVEVCDLLQSDILVISKSLKLWENRKRIRLHGMEKNTDVIRNLLITMTDDTITEQDTISIGISGNSIMDQYQPDTIYITKTEITSIIAYPISNVSQETCISNCIKMIFDQINLQKNVEMQQKNGIDQKKVEGGIESMQNVAVSQRDLSQLYNALNAMKNMKQDSRIERDFVQISVSRNGVERFVLTMSLQTASHVLLNLQKISTPNPNFVPNPVAGKPIGQTKTRVYDLSVAECHEYFADGILVHNCIDSLRYAFFTHKIAMFDYEAHNKQQQNYMQNRFSSVFR